MGQKGNLDVFKGSIISKTTEAMRTNTDAFRTNIKAKSRNN